MNLKEIENYLAVSRSGEVCVEITIVGQYPSLVRTISIRKGPCIIVEFNDHGFDEGGPQVELKYETLEGLVAALEVFLTKNVESWENCNKAGLYPEAPDISTARLDWQRLKDDLHDGSLELPVGWISCRIH